MWKKCVDTHSRHCYPDLKRVSRDLILKHIGSTCVHHRECTWLSKLGCTLKLLWHRLGNELMGFRWKWSNFVGNGIKIQHMQKQKVRSEVEPSWSRLALLTDKKMLFFSFFADFILIVGGCRTNYIYIYTLLLVVFSGICGTKLFQESSICVKPLLCT